MHITIAEENKLEVGMTKKNGIEMVKGMGWQGKQTKWNETNGKVDWGLGFEVEAFSKNGRLTKRLASNGDGNTNNWATVLKVNNDNDDGDDDDYDDDDDECITCHAKPNVIRYLG